jgi:hypothetical protein
MNRKGTIMSEEQLDVRFLKGFFLCKQLFALMGQELDLTKMLELLHQIADGDLSLNETPEELIQSLPDLPESLRESVYKLHTGEQRRELDAANKVDAQILLNLFEAK